MSWIIKQSLISLDCYFPLKFGILNPSINPCFERFLRSIPQQSISHSFTLLPNRSCLVGKSIRFVSLSYIPIAGPAWPARQVHSLVHNPPTHPMHIFFHLLLRRAFSFSHQEHRCERYHFRPRLRSLALPLLPSRQRRSCFSSRSFSPPEGARKNPPDFVARDGRADERTGSMLLCYYTPLDHAAQASCCVAKVLATQFAPSQHQSSPRLNVIRESSKVDLL